MKAIVLLANGFEEVEGIAQIDYLRRAGIEVTSASIHEDKRIVGQSMIAVSGSRILTRREQEIPHFYKWWDELR